MIKAPILLLVFNRPTLTKRVFDCIRQYKPDKLYISADGPRSNVSDDFELCALTRELFKTIDWKCNLVTNFSESNKGCRIAVYDGISWFFQHEEMGIILEDDIVPLPIFFDFCNEALDFYKNYSQIGMISGMNFSDSKNDYEPNLSSQFSNYAFIWGWATWKRTWDKYELNLENWDGVNTEFMNSIKYINPRLINAWRNMFNLVKYKNFNTWDYQLNYLLFSNSLLTVVPSKNLIDNIGFGINSTHTKENKPKWLHQNKSKIQHINLSTNFDDLTQNKFFSEKVFADNRYNQLKFSIKKLLNNSLVSRLFFLKKYFYEIR